MYVPYSTATAKRDTVSIRTLKSTVLYCTKVGKAKQFLSFFDVKSLQLRSGNMTEITCTTVREKLEKGRKGPLTPGTPTKARAKGARACPPRLWLKQGLLRKYCTFLGVPG